MSNFFWKFANDKNRSALLKIENKDEGFLLLKKCFLGEISEFECDKIQDVVKKTNKDTELAILIILVSHLRSFVWISVFLIGHIWLFQD